MTLIAALFAASLSIDPPRLILGRDGSATVTVKASAGAKVALSTTAGAIGPAAREGSTFRATFLPPKRKAPAVALILAQVDDELLWAALPLSGSDTMEIETRPGSTVEARVGETVIGPVVADKKGNVRLPMVVPPGVGQATLHIVDKLGNATDKPLDLDPPPFTRVRAAARPAQPGVAEVEIFAVKPDGTPDDDAGLSVEGAPLKRIGHGVYLARRAAAAGSVHLEARAYGQTSAADVTVLPGAPRTLWSSSLSRPWTVSLGLLGGPGATFDGAHEADLVAEGALRIARLPLEVVIDGGGAWFSEVSQYGPNPTNDERARAQSRFVRFGARFDASLSGALDGYAALLFGWQSQLVTRRPPNAAPSASDDWSQRYAGAIGITWTLGPGRIVAQLEADASPAGLAGLEGSLSGFSVMGGYLLTLY